MYACTRTNINNMVGSADRVFVVLDHNHRVTEVAQVDQGFQQTLVVALMQADRRLIQHVHHAHQTGTNLARQTDTLGFAAGQRFRRT
ncbi:hypothetical protein SRABI106_04759 [Rahnella aquatilis]|nr:hypothetical protein SRABI106_04759 [Rahnella aquatilis]